MLTRISIIILLFIIPFTGIAFALSSFSSDEFGDFLPTEQLILDLDEMSNKVLSLRDEGLTVFHTAEGIKLNLEGQEQYYAEQQKLIESLISKSLAQKDLSYEIYEKNLLSKLGQPITSYESDKVEILVFETVETQYRGYIAKVKLFDPSALKVSLAHNEYGRIEATSSAVKREGAVFGVNGGGFFYTLQGGSGVYHPIGNTVINGNLIGGFTPSTDDVFFSGLTENGSLIGGKFYNESSLMNKNPNHGVSFVPILIQNRLPVSIPSQWQRTRHPRTVIGNFPNGDIFFIAIDGRQRDWSRGATLEELQIQMLKLGVESAYNLDGGGSTTMVFDGKVINRPSDGSERPVATNILIFGD